MKSSAHAAELILKEALRLLGEVEEGRCTLDDALDQHLTTPEFRRSIASLLFTCFRRRKWLEKAVGMLAQRPPRPEVKRLIMLALTQIWFQRALAPESAANVAVALGGKCFSRPEANFINALLRRRPELPPPGELERAEAVLPDRILARWRQRFTPTELAEQSAAFLTVPPVTFRSERGWEPGELAARAMPGFGAFRFYEAVSPEALLSSEAFAAGQCYLQDPAASLAVSLPHFDNVGTMLDLCAAPGGKALALLEAAPAGARLTAADHSESRQQLTRENFARRRLSAEIITADPSELTGSFDLVLADVPCSNTGVFRHRPDALWRFREKELKHLVTLQRRLLDEAARLTAPGGQLVYSTCSLEREENTDQVAQLLQRHPEFSLEREEQLLPNAEHDGAFAALLRKK